MAIRDQLLFGTYVGLVLDTRDPDNLGRVKLMVPGKTGPLFQGWNDVEGDIEFSTASSTPFTTELKNRLCSVLPWARPSTPIFGGGTGAPVNQSNGIPSLSPELTTRQGTTGKDNSFTPAGVNTQYSKPTRPVDAKYIVLHDTSGNDLITQDNNNGNFYNYVIKDGIAYEIAPAGQYAGHAYHLNSSSIGIARVGMEGQPISAQDAAAMSSLISQLSQQFNIPASNIITHPEGGADATSHGGKDAREADWKDQVLANSTLSDGIPQGPNDNRKIADHGINNTSGDFGPERGLDGDPCTSSLDGNPLDKDQAKLYSVALNKKMDQSGLQIGYSGNKMDKQSLLTYLTERFKCSPLLAANLSPEEAAAFQITNTKDPAQWANFVSRVAGAEYGGGINREGDPDMLGDPGGSNGPWSSSASINTEGTAGDALVYAGYRDMTASMLNDPRYLGRSANIIASTIESQVLRNNSLQGLNHDNGGSFAPSTMAALSNQDLDISKSGDRRLVQRTTASGMNSYASLNVGRYGGPRGFFSIPHAGAKVWVTFEGGSPQRPIYMGQVYEPSNIQSVAA